MCPDSARLTLEFSLSSGFACDIYIFIVHGVCGWAFSSSFLTSDLTWRASPAARCDSGPRFPRSISISGPDKFSCGVEWEWQELSTSNIISTTYLLSTHHPHNIRSSLIGFHYNKWATGVRRMRAQKPIWSHIKLHSKPGSLLSISC